MPHLPAWKGVTEIRNQYQKTIYACFTAYIVQAVVNNFVPLLFLIFQSGYGIHLSQITMLVTINFGLQLLVDLASVSFVNRTGCWASMVLAHALAAAGLALLSILPELLVSPVVEACPSDHKEQAMSLLHSFCCWGHVAVVLVSTVFFTLFGAAYWRALALVWALIPLAGDLGCSGGPTLEGMVSSAWGDDLRRGILAGIVYCVSCPAVSGAAACAQGIAFHKSIFATLSQNAQIRTLFVVKNVFAAQVEITPKP